MGSGTSIPHALRSRTSGVELIQRKATDLVRMKENDPTELVTPWNKVLLKGPFFRRVFAKIRGIFDTLKQQDDRLPYKNLKLFLGAVICKEGETETAVDESTVEAIFGPASSWNTHGLCWSDILGCLAIGFLQGVSVLGACPPEATLRHDLASNYSFLARAPSWKAAWGHSGLSPPVQNDVGKSPGSDRSPTKVIVRKPSGLLHAQKHAEAGRPLSAAAVVPSPDRLVFTAKHALELEGDSEGAAMLARETAQELHQATSETRARNATPPCVDHSTGTQEPHIKASPRPILKVPSQRGKSGTDGISMAAGQAVSVYDSPGAAKGHIRFACCGPPDDGIPLAIGPAFSPAVTDEEGGPNADELSTVVPAPHVPAGLPPLRVATASPIVDTRAMAHAFHLALEAYMQLDSRKVGTIDLVDLKSSMAQVLLSSPSHSASPAHSARLDEMARADGHKPLGLLHRISRTTNEADETPLDILAVERFAELTTQNQTSMPVGEDTSAEHRLSMREHLSKLFFPPRASPVVRAGSQDASAQITEVADAAVTHMTANSQVTFTDFLAAFSAWFGISDEEGDN